MHYILTEKTLTAVFDGIPRSLHRGECGESAWNKALEALEAGDHERLRKYVDTGGAVNAHFAGTPIRIENSVLYYDDEPMENYAATKAVELVKQELPHQPLIAFIQRLDSNPSNRAVKELYSFLEHNNMPLTPEGKFLAYKKVRRKEVSLDPEGESGDIPPKFMLVDCHTGTICNDPGTVVSMPRNRVDEDPNHTCSHGLHVCSYQYLPSFGNGAYDLVVAVEVDPADVVAVPNQYNEAKMRVCRYKVLQVIDYDGTGKGHYWGDRAVVDDYQDEEEDEEDEDEDFDRDREQEAFDTVKDLSGYDQFWVAQVLRSWLHRRHHFPREHATVRGMILDLLSNDHGYTRGTIVDYVRQRAS